MIYQEVALSDVIPAHVAVIMDGNGRWAKQKGKNKEEGHRRGGERLLDIVDAAGAIGVQYITFYAFSTENWKRPKQEVDFLMQLLEDFFKREMRRAIEQGVCVRFIGDLSKLPARTQKVLEDARVSSAQNTKITVFIALNYGARDELTRAVNVILEKSRRGEISAVTDQIIADHLDTAGIPDPELLIRTSGEMRVSNFLLYQIAYAELYITDTLWPDFGKKEFALAIEAFQKRERRFGGR